MQPPPKAPAEKMRKIFAVLACVALVCAVLGYFVLSQTPEHDKFRVTRTAMVDYVVDGDTINLQGGEKVRLVGVNTPEVGSQEEPGGREAKEFVESLCSSGTEIRLDVDDLEPKDHYGRTLAVIYVELEGSWVNLNAELLRRGHAEILFYPPSEFNPYEWTNTSQNVDQDTSQESDQP